MIAPMTDSVRSDSSSSDEQPYFPLTSQEEALSPDTIAAIDSTVTKLKELRFVFEHENNLAALHRLEDELLVELDLLETTKWSVQHHRVTAIFSDAVSSPTSCRKISVSAQQEGVSYE